MSEKTDFDRAIEAYRFQVERYHTWMNYYSLFHGALLIAFYSLLKDVPKEQAWLPFVIASLGFLAGICWCYTVIGNKNWINNWMEVIRHVKSQSIYSKVAFKYKDKKRCYYKWHSLLSTQKVTLGFTLFVTIAWAIVAWNFTPCEIKYETQVAIVGFSILAIILVLFENPLIHSDIEKMEEIR